LRRSSQRDSTFEGIYFPNVLNSNLLVVCALGLNRTSKERTEANVAVSKQPGDKTVFAETQLSVLYFG
jgi:hypothetical protein